MSLEQSIKDIVKEHKAKLEEANQATKNAVAAEPSHLTGTAGEVKPNGSGNLPGEASHLTGNKSEQNPDNKKAYEADTKDVENSTSKKANPATKNAVAAEPSHLKSKMQEDIDALISGEELTEEFKEKAATIFEAAVLSRVKDATVQLEKEFDSQLSEAVEQSVGVIVEHVDGYLAYIAEQWMKENEIALEVGMKSEILEGFISGLKTLFAEHYIEVPDEKFDVLSSLEEKSKSLESKLNEQMEVNVKLKKTLNEMKRSEIISEIGKGLVDTDADKFKNLVEELSYEDSESFKSKVTTIKENYFKASPKVVNSVVTDTPVGSSTEPGSADQEVAAIARAMKNY